MSEPAPPPAPSPASSERRTFRWLLGGQVFLALLLVGLDLGPTLPGLMTPSNAPTLDLPVRPGDQTRRYDPTRPRMPGPGMDPDMPRRLMATAEEIDGRSGMTLFGAIEPGDGARIIDELRRVAPAVVALNSPGGSVSDALEIGQMIRALGMDARVAGNAICLSACPYMFVGGVARVVDPGGRIGVHQHSFGESTVLPAFLATEDIQRGQAEVLAHLDAMGIDLRVMGPAMATPADEIYILTDEEMQDWQLVTD